MNKTLITIIAGVIIIGGGAVVVANQSSDNDSAANNETNVTTPSEEAAMEQKKADEAAMVKEEEAEAMKKDENGEVMEKKANTERFVTLADFESNQSTYADTTKVYFFHASWCSICKGIENEINADQNRIPEGTTFIKTDFDSQTDLRKEYSVTTQYTFVQVDNDGNLVKRWSATNLDKAIAGIQS